MGSLDDIIPHFIEKDIRRHFPSCDGWKMAKTETLSGYDRIILLERNAGPNFESIVLGVSFAPKVPDAILSRVRSTTSTTLPRHALRERKAILVPRSADVTSAGDDIGVFHMKNYVFEGSELVWHKHPNRRFEQVKKAAAPAQ